MTEIKQKPIVANQHFVPKFYLKRFANEKGFLKVLDIKSGKMSSSWRPYSSLCYEKFYYAANTGVQDVISQQVEDLFCDLENRIATQLDVIYEKILNYQPISNNERYLLATFAAMLYLRGGYMRAQIQRMAEDLFKKTMKLRVGDPNFAKYLNDLTIGSGTKVTSQEIQAYQKLLKSEKYNVSFNNAQHISIIAKIENFANLFYNKNWLVHLAKGSREFFTSDTPVVEWIPERKFAYGASFLERKHYLVLSPKMVIEFNHPFLGKRLKRKWSSESDVFDLNVLRLNLSMKEAYSRRINEFEEHIMERSDSALSRLLSKLSRLKN